MRFRLVSGVLAIVAVAGCDPPPTNEVPVDNNVASVENVSVSDDTFANADALQPDFDDATANASPPDDDVIAPNGPETEPPRGRN